MLAISDAVKEAWLSPARQLSIRVKVDKTTYGSEDVSSLSFDSGSISGEVYQIGSTYMNSVILSFPSIIETIKEDQEVIPELGILVDGEYHFSKLGHFYITEFNRDRNANVTTITANDKMIYLEGVYDSKLTYPKPYREVALEIANLAGVEVNQASFASLGIGAIKKPEGYTFRQAIGLIAQFEGGFASFNRDGELEIRRLRPTEFSVTPESYLLKGFTKNENSYKIGGITVRVGEEETDVLKVGTDTGSQVELENKSMTQDLLNQVWRLVKDINYFPYELKWRGCPALEAGDWIYVTDRNGKRYSVPNLSYSMNFNGGLSAESKATTNSVSGNATKYRGTLNQKVQWLESILSSNDWNHNYYDAEPGNPKVGDLWFKKVGKDIEIWQYVETDGVQDWELQISSAPNQELLDMIEDLVKETADAQAAAEEAKAAGEAAEQLAEEAKTESAKAIEDANTAVAGVTNLGQIVQAVDQAAQLAIEQSANAVTDAQAAMVKANDILGTVTELEGTITNITTDIDAINGELSVKVDQTTFNQLKGTVDTHSTSISANAQAITQKANQTQVNAIDQTVISHTAELTTQADKIAGLVTKTDGQSTKISALELQAGQFNLTLSNVQQEVAGIEVGGRNYYKKSTTISGKSGLTNIKKEYQDAVNGLYFVGVSGDKGGLRINNVISSNGWWTVSFWVRGSQNVGVFFDLDICDYGQTKVTTTNDNTWKYVTHSVNVTNYTATVYNFVDFDNVMWAYFYVKDFKVEKGNKATDWTPAPEDMATATALTSVQATVDGLVTTVATKANQSQVTQLADQITSIVSSQSALSTDNLLKNSDFESDDLNSPPIWWNVGTVTPRGRVVANPDPVNGSNQSSKVLRSDYSSTGDINLVSDYIKVEVGGTYTGAIKVRWSGPINQGGTFIYSVQGYKGDKSTVTFTSTLLTDSSIHAWATLKTNNVTIPSGTEYVRIWLNNRKNPSYLWYDDVIFKRVITDKDIDSSVATSSQITQLSDQINLRVTKDDVVNQINISPDGVLIAANKIQITGLTKIDNAVIATAHIKDLAVTNAKIANLAVNTAKIGDAAIVTAKIGDLAVTNAKIANLAINDAKIQNASISSAKIISLDANKISAGEVRGLVITSTSSTGRFLVEGQNAVFQNTSTNRKTEINENGVNIYNANGTLRAQFNQNVVNTGIVGTNTYNVYLGTGGVDGTEGEAEGGEVRVVRYDSTPGTGAVTDYVYRPIRAEGFVGNYINVNTPISTVSHLYLRPRYITGEVRVTGSGTTDRYQDLRANGVYANTMDFNSLVSGTGTNIYIRPKSGGEVQFTATGSTTNYVPIRADVAWLTSVSSIDTGTNFYVGTDGEVRATSRGMGSGTIVYRNVRAAGYYGGFIDTTATNMYVRAASGGEVRATVNGGTSTYVPVRASSFPTSSLAEYKQDIVEHNESALNVINSATIYDYRLRSEVANGKNRVRTGLVIGAGYNTPQTVIDGDGVEQYMMNSLSWKAIQELSSKVKELENQIRVLQLQVA